MELTKEQLESNSHISTDEILLDIDDTNIEIEQYEMELEILRKNPIENKLPIYMNEGRVIQRREFVYKLNQILKHRGAEKV